VLGRKLTASIRASLCAPPQMHKPSLCAPWRAQKGSLCAPTRAQTASLYIKEKNTTTKDRSSSRVLQARRPSPVPEQAAACIDVEDPRPVPDVVRMPSFLASVSEISTDAPGSAGSTPRTGSRSQQRPGSASRSRRTSGCGRGCRRGRVTRWG